MLNQIVSFKEITNIFNEDNLAMIGSQDFDNAFALGEKIEYIQLSLEEYNEDIKDKLLKAQAVFIIVEVLKDELLDEKQKKSFELISNSLLESELLLIDTKIVSQVSDEPLHIISFSLS